MNMRYGIILAAAFILGGCATQQQTPITFSKTVIQTGSARVGIAMAPLPELDTQVPGADCLLCLAVATHSNSALTSHAKTLGHEELPDLKNEVAAILRKHGVSVVVINEPFNLRDLPSFSGTGPNVAPKNYGGYKAKYSIDKLLVLNISALGFTRSYSAYVPTSDPKALFKALGYMVDLSNNTYDWYEPVEISKSAEQKWDEPPKFPGLTNAYYQALEMGKDRLLKPLSSPTETTKAQVLPVASQAAK